MPQFLQVTLAAILVLGPLIAVHEFGHFYVARRLGVKVLVYSIGFGKGFIKWRDKKGTLYQITAIPLGGYVKMVDEREGEVAPEDLPYAFTRQPVWKRMAIVAAGPGINLLFAVFLFWLIFMRSSDVVRPVVQTVDAGSPAAVAGVMAGDEIRRVGDKATADWDEVSYALIDRIGDSGALALTVRGKGNTADRQVTLTLDHYLHDAGSDPLQVLGLHTYLPIPDAVIQDVTADSPGARQGLLAGDRFVQVDGKPVGNWLDVVKVFGPQPGKAIPVIVQRAGKDVALTLTPEAKKDDNGKTVGRLGIRAIDPPPPPADMIMHTRLGPVAALDKAVRQTTYFSLFTLDSLWKMLTGRISVDNLSGPIGIAKVAGQSVAMGVWAVLGLMAILSISLGVLNLLPVPVLDGGHLVYYAVEGVLGRPLSEKTQMLGLRIGVALLGSLMLLAIFNDLSRLF
jgi:regulator of sigma E protease